MSVILEEVLRSAMQLSEAEKLILASELLGTVADALPGLSVDDPAFEAELERRAGDGSPGIPWNLVQAQLRADLER